MEARTTTGDGGPIPASQPMNRETAEWYVTHTRGQLQAFPDGDGKWYLYLPDPAPVIEPLSQVHVVVGNSPP